MIRDRRARAPAVLATLGRGATQRGRARHGGAYSRLLDVLELPVQSRGTVMRERNPADFPRVAATLDTKTHQCMGSKQ